MDGLEERRRPRGECGGFVHLYGFSKRILSAHRNISALDDTFEAVALPFLHSSSPFQSFAPCRRVFLHYRESPPIFSGCLFPWKLFELCFIYFYFILWPYWFGAWKMIHFSLPYGRTWTQHRVLHRFSDIFASLNVILIFHFFFPLS